MSEEPRRSGRATKGQHKHASSSPAPTPAPTAKASNAASSKSSKSKPSKKSQEPDPNEEEDEDEVIRCICGNTNAKDRRAFIGCDACTVWQHNVCMGLPDDEDDVPDHYFCEDCHPEDHPETVQAIARGEKIWEVRNKIFQNEKKMSKSRKNKSKSGEEYRPGWLKKDVKPLKPEAEPALEPEPEAAAEPTPPPANGLQEAGTKRKRDKNETDDKPKIEEQPESEVQPVAVEKPERPARQDNKRRKSSNEPTKASADAETALVSMDQLPKDRQKVTKALASIIETDVEGRANKSGMKLPENQTPKAYGEQQATRIEYALHMNHGVLQPAYGAQFRALHANLKKNPVLIQRLLDGSLTADELSTMSSGDMASEELQRERAEMKEALDRQAVAVEEPGPKYAQDHKGYHLIENEAQTHTDLAPPAKPTGGASSPQDQVPSGSPTQGQQPLIVDTTRQPDVDRRPSSQHFDMNNIWAKTAQSPTNPTPPNIGRPMQAPARRRSSLHPTQAPQNGAKDDPDIDRMLEDNDDTYVPPDATGADAIVWRGKLVQSSEEAAPTVNARFVAGRDLAATVPWEKLLPSTLSIDGRLAVQKAEDYLCGLRWSTSSDVTVLSLSPYDNAEAFNNVFNYFATRERYAVVEKGKAAMVKDLYIIPVEAGAALPSHVEMLEHCSIKKPIEERLLLATLILARAPDSPTKTDANPGQQASNGHLPQHVRQSLGGPAGSPLTSHGPTFSPSNNATPQSGYGPPGGFPPNPYGPPQAQQPPPYPPPQQPHPDPRVNEILGELQFVPTARTILSQAQGLTDSHLHNLKLILTEDLAARTDFDALSSRLDQRG